MKISKNMLVGAMAVVLAVGITFSAINGFYKRKVRDIQSSHTVQIERIEWQRDSVKTHSDSTDLLLAFYKGQNDSLEINDGLHRVEIDDLKMRLKRALNHMWDQYLEDNGLYAYDYLQGRYLSKDTLEYLFSGEQVTYMATDIIKGDYLDSLSTIEQERILNLENQIINYKGAVGILEKDRDDFKLLTDDLYNQLAAKIEELQMSEEEIAELKRKLRIRTAGGAGAMIGLVALLILL